MNSPLDSLNPIQREAVSHTEGPLLILAGAGSGKTRTITYRVWYLITQRGVSPWNILAVTFTNKAAEEMKNRVRALLHHSDGLKVWISTFHSACVRILRQHIFRLGMSSDFAILDAHDQVKIVKKCVADVDDHPQTIHPYAVMAEIRRAKNDLLSAVQYRDLARGDFFQTRVARIFQAYEERLSEDQALDFDDLLLLTYRLFQECPDVLEHYRNLCRYLMVDEYQDTNHAQAQLVNLLAQIHRNICVVGDDDQSIYRWRGADIRNILDFEKVFPEVRTLRLEQNYRSTRTILGAANHLISHNNLRKVKKLWTENEEGTGITLHEAQDEQAESRYISQKVRKLKVCGFSDYRDFAILYRTNAQSRTIEEALRNDGIPYQIVGGLKFYERKEIKDLIAYLKVISNPDNRLSLQRIINVPPRKIGQTSLAKIEALADENRITFGQALIAILKTQELNSTQRHHVSTFLQSLKKWKDFCEGHTLSQLLDLVLKDIDYFAYLQEEQTDQAEARIENVKELQSGIRHFESQNPDSSLEEFLDYVSLLSDIDEYHEGSGAVTLMTVHSAKGLEFPVVFITGMEEKLFPLARSTMNAEDLEEERRLCYVGMTRARNQLFFTRAEQRMIYGTIQETEISRFIEEIPQDFFCLGTPGTTEAKAARRNAACTPEAVRGAVPFAATARTEKAPKQFFSSKGWENQTPDEKKGNGKLQPGDRVYHEQWGEGVIFHCEGEGEHTKVSVNFGGLRKKLLVKYARLKKI
ncbi:MAG: UvrD-helicase domain-containing protein [bacterium]